MLGKTGILFVDDMRLKCRSESLSLHLPSVVVRLHEQGVTTERTKAIILFCRFGPIRSGDFRYHFWIANVDDTGKGAVPLCDKGLMGYGGRNAYTDRSENLAVLAVPF